MDVKYDSAEYKVYFCDFDNLIIDVSFSSNWKLNFQYQIINNMVLGLFE